LNINNRNRTLTAGRELKGIWYGIPEDKAVVGTGIDGGPNI